MISIHALLAESDARTKTPPRSARNFYPRSPCGERLTGLLSAALALSHFYPRSPCGERLAPAVLAANFELFLSTLSLRRATDFISPANLTYEISIHALLAESDV